MFRKSACLAIAVLTSTQAQISFRPHSHHVFADLISPWKGPGSAQFNPAALSETGKAYGHLGFTSFKGFDGIYPIYQFAADLPVGLSVGLGGFVNSSKIDNSNAVFLEDILVPGFAFAWPLEAGSKYRVAAGLSLPIYHFNSFGAVKNHDAGLDLGLLYAFNPHAALGWLRLGMAFQRLLKPEVELPDDRGNYEVPGENDFLLTWNSPHGLVEIHLALYRMLQDEFIENEKPGFLYWRLKDIKTWGVQVAPLPWLAFKVERPLFTWLATYGVVGKLDSLLGYPLFLELDIGHADGIHPTFPDWLWNPLDSDGREFFLSMSIGAEI